jgi:hypothetical protein
MGAVAPALWEHDVTRDSVAHKFPQGNFYRKMVESMLGHANGKASIARYYKTIEEKQNGKVL